MDSSFGLRLLFNKDSAGTHALQRLTYSFYLRDKLDVKLRREPTQEIHIIDTWLSREKLEPLLGDSSHKDYSDTIFNWAGSTTIQQEKTLDLIYKSFAIDLNPKVFSYKDFISTPTECAKYLADNLPAFERHLDAPNVKRHPFTEPELVIYGFTLGVSINLNRSSSENDKILAIRLMGLVIGVLLQGENTFAKDMALRRIKSDVKRAVQHSGGEERLKDIETRIEKYLDTNPIVYRGNSWKTMSVQARLLSLLGVFIAISILIYFTLTTFLNNNKFSSLVDLDDAHVEAKKSGSLLESNLYQYSEIPGYLILRTPSSLDSANYWFDKARNEHGDKGLILEYLNRAIKLDPTFFAAYALRGDIFKEQRKFDRAETEYSYAIRFGPPDAIFYYKRALMRHALKRSHLASEDIEKSVALYPDSLKYNDCYASIEMLRGMVLSELGDFELSISCYARALQNNPNNPELFLMRAASYENLDFLDSAINDYLQYTVLGSFEHDSSDVSHGFTRTAFCYYDLSKKKSNKSYRITHLSNAVSFADSAMSYAPRDTGVIGIRNALYNQLLYETNDY